MKKQEVRTGSQILKDLETRCGEELKCSMLLRFHITQTIQRLLDENHAMRANIKNVLEGFATYNPEERKTIKISK